VVGVAITTVSVVPGCATGASHFQDVEEAARFALEVAKEFGKGNAPFYDRAEFENLTRRYGTMEALQTLGR
jgi:hypothetical protein